MAAPFKPDLKVTHDRLLGIAQYYYEVIARMQAAHATTGMVTLASLEAQALALTQSYMELEVFLEGQPAS